MRTIVAIVALVFSLCQVTLARAHGTRAVTVDVTEAGPGKAIVRLRSTLAPKDVKGVRALLSQPCSTTSAEQGGEDVMLADCPGGIRGAEVRVKGLGPILSEAILIVSLTDGERITRVLTAGEPSFVLPAAQTAVMVARSYVKLGVIHILTGYDHLLFLVGLVLLLRTARAVFLAETAFTISHSLSFSGTATGLVRVSAPAAEAVIALSLILLALDIGKPPKGGASARRVERQGIVMAFVFGLVHGLGFAGGLSEIGLPEAHVPLALVGFAGGVEAGQVAFLLVTLALLSLAERGLARHRIEAGIRLGSLAIGSLATYWLVERTLALLSSRV
jgi:hydrogenase/urease accessory protein HupE